MFIDDVMYYAYMSREEKMEQVARKLISYPIHMINDFTIYNAMISLGLNPDDFTSSEIKEIYLKRANM